MLQSPLFNPEDLNVTKDEIHYVDRNEQDGKVNMRKDRPSKKDSKRKVIFRRDSNNKTDIANSTF